MPLANPRVISGDDRDSEPKWSWKQFWKVAEVMAIVCFPIVAMIGGYFACKVLDHETQIAVMTASYYTKDEAEDRENGLKQSIDSLKQTINDLRIEIVKVASKEHDGR